MTRFGRLAIRFFLDISRAVVSMKLKIYGAALGQGPPEPLCDIRWRVVAVLPQELHTAAVIQPIALL